MRTTQKQSTRVNKVKPVLREDSPKGLNEGEKLEHKTSELCTLFSELDEINYSTRWETLQHLELCFSELAKINQLFTAKSFHTLSTISQLFLLLGEHKQLISEQRKMYERLADKQEKRFRAGWRYF